MKNERILMNKAGFILAGATHVDLPPTNAKKGFTLAEVLITLGIIGIVAAMTLPVLMTNIRKHQTETALAKAVSTLTQALKLSEQENGSISALDRNNISQKDFIKQYIAPYMKVSELCYPATNCGYTSSLAWKYLDGQTCGAYCNLNHGGRIPFLAMDGIVYAVSFFSDDSGNGNEDNNNLIIIDINGSKLPNSIGRDVFFLYRREDIDEISAYGYDKTDNELKNSCKIGGSGLYCTALIQRNGWKIPKDYPWF